MNKPKRTLRKLVLLYYHCKMAFTLAFTLSPDPDKRCGAWEIFSTCKTFQDPPDKNCQRRPVPSPARLLQSSEDPESRRQGEQISGSCVDIPPSWSRADTRLASALSESREWRSD